MKAMNPWLDGIWVLLVLATGLTWWLGDSGHAGMGTVVAILVIAGFKGVMVIGEFMALRGVRWIWPTALLAWLLVVLAVNMLVYWR